MQQTHQATAWEEHSKHWGEVRRESAGVEAVVETLANLSTSGEGLAELAHDTRNMVTALGLYCDLLEQPGVLAPAFLHYGCELRLVAAASRRLVEKMVALDERNDAFGLSMRQGAFRDAAMQLPKVIQLSKSSSLDLRPRPARMWEMLPAVPIDDLAGELLANRNLLAALAGPTIALTVDTEGGALPVQLTGEDLTRVLVNLVKNAAQAMVSGGIIALTLRQRPTSHGDEKTLLLTIADSGPGIPRHDLEKVFEAGFSTLAAISSSEGWPATHRGLGLSITRSIIDAAGGRVTASNGDHGGATLSIELPVRKR
jgi:signal transduction histidine kinase